jgi:hypothetical protein
MIIEYIPENHKQLYWTTSRFLIIFTIVVGSYFLIYNYTDFSRGNTLRATGIITSGILTFALISVYRGLAETQKRQTKTLHQQEKLMEIPHKPDIIVESWGVSKKKPEGKLQEDEPHDVLNVVLSNIGEGSARNIRLGIHITYAGYDEWSMDDEMWNDLKENIPTLSVYREEYKSNLGNFLYPGEEGINFKSGSSVIANRPHKFDYNTYTTPEYDKHAVFPRTTFKNKLNKLIDEYGEGDYLLTVKLSYADRTGEVHSEIIYCVIIEQKESDGRTLESVIDKGYVKGLDYDNTHMKPENIREDLTLPG